MSPLWSGYTAWVKSSQSRFNNEPIESGGVSTTSIVKTTYELLLLEPPEELFTTPSSSELVGLWLSCQKMYHHSQMSQ